MHRDCCRAVGLWGWSAGRFRIVVNKIGCLISTDVTYILFGAVLQTVAGSLARVGKYSSIQAVDSKTPDHSGEATLCGRAANISRRPSKASTRAQMSESGAL